MTEKVILDTDIGSDIDDAVCLAYLLAQPRCELLGITTVTGEAVKRARMASALCKVAKKKIPIFPGCEKPMFVPQLQTRAPQAEVRLRSYRRAVAGRQVDGLLLQEQLQAVLAELAAHAGVFVAAERRREVDRDGGVDHVRAGADLAGVEEMLKTVADVPLTEHYVERIRIKRLGAAEVAAETPSTTYL